MNRRIATLGVGIALIAATSVVFSQDVSQQIYEDHNGYFIAVSPAGWRTHDFPAETVRSKTRFDHPDIQGVYIGVIAAPSPRSGYSLNDLLAESEQKAGQIKRLVPGAKLTVGREKVRDREAVVQRVERGGTEVKSITFISQDVFYQITFSTDSNEQREVLSATFGRFVDSFTILDRGRTLSDAERKATLVARFSRLAELYEQTGDTSQALESARQGLQVDPQNRKLVDIERRLKNDRR